ncbi:hypothetical protein BHE18_05500 [Rossellomorea aquimaris]|uniref:Uncharacterized protein n=1 Tax=Rossellomorea aquimaris TaxID=189382 RepID=A0A1J6W3G3_9BACI|nr:hypothetical protein BHE18_05500 [Rossellomorea aquimaris]
MAFYLKKAAIKFFVVFLSRLIKKRVQRLIGVQNVDSCGRSGLGETPQAKPRRLTSRPRKAKFCTEINSGDEWNQIC